jgi:ribonuclease-3
MSLPIDRQQAILAFMAHPFWSIPRLGEAGLDLLNQALTHDSFAKEQGDRGYPCKSYERLEFLGDRILNHAVAEFLFRHYPEAEGALTNRIQFTKNSNLARVVKDQNLGIHPPLVRLGQGQTLKDSIIADVFEALIAAIYLMPDQGMAKVQTIVNQQLAEAIHAFQPENPKGRLQIYLQQHFRREKLDPEDLEYLVISDQIEADNRHRVTVQVNLLGRPWGQGQGSNRKEATQAAAKAALARIDSGASPF